MPDPTGAPWLVVIALFLLPIGVAVFVGAMAFRRMTPLVFECRRCNHVFHRPAHHRFPAACPRCKARDWSSPAASVRPRA
ncbi:MAG TPA: hypothetical protein VGD37_15060 [Kofleriaceae bacterium]|jgi:hypothetical protein